MTVRNRLIELLKSNQSVLQAAGTSATATLRLADHLIANGVTVPNRGRWVIHSSGRGSETTNWAECSECHVCGSPQWRVCPVCEARMVE